MSITVRTLSAAALIALVIATPGIARTGDGLTTQVRVKRAAGMREMERRRAAGAMEACGGSTFSLAAYREAITRSACYRTALATARGQIARNDTSSDMNRGGR